MALSIAVDIGGTFTDLVAYDDVTGRTLFSKSPTTPQDLSRGILNALDKAGIQLPDASTLKHGTTVVINTVLEGTGARVGLVTTKGFRDSLEIGRGNRSEPFNFHFRRRPPVVPRHLRLEVEERMLAGGVPLQAPKMDDLEQAAGEFRRQGVEAVALCFLHAYANPEHEAQAAAFFAGQGFPYVSVSSDLSREWREYERTSTAVLNGYVAPRVCHYLERLEGALEEHGFRGSLFLMESNGGVMSVATARRKPIYLVESGPVAGVTGATAVGASSGLQNLVAFDMGGTTAKASLVENLTPRVEPLYFIGGYERGYPIQAPVVDIVEVGAGGGSIAWLDSVGSLNVGPRSAGAEPGPVCYQAGGTEPTITDANLVLGRLNPLGFLGGEMMLDFEAALRALRDRVAAPLGEDPLRIAAGILRIANVVMAGAVRRVTVERGRDPRDFAMVAFGGAGPLHASAIAREVGIPKVIVPPAPGHFSAMGMLLADLRHDYARSHSVPLENASLEEIQGILRQMEAAGSALAREEVPGLQEVAITRWADMRYVGQDHTVKVSLPDRLEGHAVRAEVGESFRRTYETRYGYSDPHGAIEVVTLRVSVEGRTAKPDLSGPYGEPAREDNQDVGAGVPARPGLAPHQREERPVYFEEAGGFVHCPIFRRELLPEGWFALGPAVVEEYASTTLIHPGDRVRLAAGGPLEISVGGNHGDR